MASTLRLQITLFLTLLVSIIIALGVLSRINYAEIKETEDRLDNAFRVVEQISELERDVIDLQRNLLIFKETASDLAAERFQQLMVDVIERTEKIDVRGAEYASLNLGEEPLERMRGHLKDYRENFQNVIELRKNREALYSELEAEFEKLEAFLNVEEVSKSGSTDFIQTRRQVAEARFHISAYLLSPDSEHVVAFKSIYKKLTRFFLDNKSAEFDAGAALKVIKVDFNKLNQTTRGYVFLVNVVMAGSANEFLYITKGLRAAAIEYQYRLSDQTRQLAETSRAEVDAVSVISIVIAIIIAFIIFYRIIAPIGAMTRVFNSLSKDKAVGVIPGAERKDEIGALAKAAQVFNDKNKQTALLLSEARSMNAQQKQLNQDLKVEKQRAEDAALSKSMFLANMSHEIRTPMNGIVGLVDLALRTELTPKQEEYLDKIAYSGQIMMNVINDILDVSKIEVGKLEIESVEFELDYVIENLIQLVKGALASKPLSIKITLAPDVPKILLGDSLRFSQVILNLCNNAIKFTEQGGFHVRFSYLKQDEILEVSVSDTGIGIEPEKLDEVFESFTQADGSMSRQYGGSGLGLTIVKQLTELMGGGVEASSVLGEGSTFTARFCMKAIGEESAIASVDNTDLSIKYLCRSSLPHFPLDVFSGLTRPVETIDTLDLSKLDISQLDPAADALLVDVSMQGLDPSMLTKLKEWADDGGRLALFYDLNPELHNPDQHINELKQLNAAVLSQPVSPTQIDKFLHALLEAPLEKPQEASDADVEEAEEEVKEQSQTKSSVADTPSSQSKDTPSETPTYSGHVLLVEDNMVNQLVAGSMLEQYGLSFDLAENGQEAVDMVCKGTHYDFVLMDVQMPVMDGYTSTSTMREKGFDELKICGLSANALQEDKDKGFAAGMNDYITKPIEPEKLEGIVKKYLC